jgi:hypothetical protein
MTLFVAKNTSEVTWIMAKRDTTRRFQGKTVELLALNCEARMKVKYLI